MENIDWENLKTEESRKIENLLKKDFAQIDAYRYNSASIRVRVIDPKFEGKSSKKRHDLIDRYLSKLPEEIEREIFVLVLLTPTELLESQKSPQKYPLNVLFDKKNPFCLFV